jgi:cysteine desulfurase
MRKLYLDHNATTPVHPEVREAMLPFLNEKFGNPSSSHWAGVEAASYIKEARAQVAGLIGCSPGEIVFTSGGSEGDNMALKGVLMKAGKGSHTITSKTEHPAVLDTMRMLEGFGFNVTYLPVGKDGIVQPDDVRDALRPETALVSIMLANNETGVLNPIAEIASIIREHGALMHTDAVQAVGKLPINARELGVDFLTASGHKFNAPKGVGFQYVRKGAEALPLISGGQQEKGLRAGTENVPGIVAIGTACSVAAREMDARHARIGSLKNKLEQGILKSVPGSLINGHPELRVYNTISISFPGIEGEALMLMLNSEGIAVSTGSACHSESGESSGVLGAMGCGAVHARGTLRLSLGFDITEEDVMYVLEKLPPMANRLLEMSTI